MYGRAQKELTPDEILARKVLSFYRAVSHFGEEELNRIREKCNNENDNEDLRIKIYIERKLTMTL